MMIVDAAAVTVTATIDITTFTNHFLSGFYFTETGGASSITVTIRKDSVAGAILWQATIPASGSIGEDYAHPVSLKHVYVAVTGSGTCQGHVRGR